MKLLKNNHGITLVELIAALALVSIVSVLIMTTLGIGIKQSIAESNKTLTQQQANLIVSKLLNEHRMGACYYIKGDSGKIKIAPTSCDSAVEPANNLFEVVSEDRFLVNMTSPAKMINPRKEDYTLIADVDFERATYRINTKLTRYKTTN